MPRKLHKLQKFCYLVTEGEEEYAFIGNYVKDRQELHVNICDAHVAEGILIYGQEIWSANIYTTQPHELVGTMLNVFKTSMFLNAPLELVYELGGMLAHEQPRAFIRHQGYPQ